MSNRGPTQIQVDVETYVQVGALLLPVALHLTKQDSYPQNTYPSAEKKDIDSLSDLNEDKHNGYNYSSQARLTEPQSHIVLN
jgi:hypothetical protein